MFAFFLHSSVVQDMNIVRRFIQNQETKEQMKIMLTQLDKYAKNKSAKTFRTVDTQTDMPSEATFYIMDIPSNITFHKWTQTDMPIYDDDYIDVVNF